MIKVGDRVIGIAGSWPGLTGEPGTVIGKYTERTGFKIDGSRASCVGWEVQFDCDPTPHYTSAIRKLEPRDDGRAVSSWHQCVWKPYSRASRASF